MLTLIAALTLTAAGPDAFSTGPLIDGFGPNAEIAGRSALPADAVFQISFDTRARGEDGAAMPGLVTAARFLNMHARAGVASDNMALAVVVHGGAVLDLAEARARPDSETARLIRALLAHNTRIIVCGQSAVYYDVPTEGLPQGVEMALSAMTAHALLQQDGYTLNPF